VTPQAWDQAKTLKLITASHKKRGLAYDGNPAYHVIIGKNWQALVRPEDSVGYHSGSWWTNRTSLAVCLVGNFNVDNPTDYQLAKLGSQLKNWSNKYNIRRNRIYLHRQVRSTACPGMKITQQTITSVMQEDLDSLRRSVNAVFRQIFGRNPNSKENSYYLARIGKDIMDRDKLINVMKFWKSRGKTMGS
jgi:hypothetical protein